MKNLKQTTIVLSICLITLASCKPTKFIGNYGQINQTQVILSENNFVNHGTFTGIATEKANKANIKDQNGLLTLARQNFLENAKNAGVNMSGSKTLINTNVDVVKNLKRITVSFTADIIEFK